MTMALVKSNISASTLVTFPQGGLSGKSKVLDVAKVVNGKIALFLETTPFHPVDRKWPDQPADRGTLTLTESGKKFKVEECEIFAIHQKTHEIIPSINVPRAEKDQWNLIVGHIIDPLDLSPESFIECTVNADVDEPYRRQLSLHHTASHLVAFALNVATKDFWTKNPPQKDSVGSPDLDKLTIEKSLIYPDRSEDFYRFGKSIGKKGLQVLQLVGKLKEVERKVNELLKEWIAKSNKVELLSKNGFRLDDTRIWHCELPVGTAEMPCGGTHMSDLSRFDKIEYRLSEGESGADEKRLIATTRATERREEQKE